MDYFIGIDEAGYGPLLGPLAVVGIGSTVAPSDLNAIWKSAHLPVMDSKKLHKSSHIAPLESVALGIITWATGFTPASASELFALLGEQPSDTADVPWCASADALSLPVGGLPIDVPSDGAMGGIHGGLLHPWHLNESASQGINRSQAEWGIIAEIIQKERNRSCLTLSCDRLGGRTYYADLLQSCLPGKDIFIQEEQRSQCIYTVLNTNDETNIYEFLVKGEQRNILIAAASCVAKYARELHMILLNQWWQKELRWLKPTAGYPQDAKRWLHQIGSGHRNAWGFHLQRGWREEHV